MTIDQLLDYMYENHRIRRQKDIAKFFDVSTQAISNWKRSGKVPAKYALKVQLPFLLLNVYLYILRKTIKWPRRWTPNSGEYTNMQHPPVSFTFLAKATAAQDQQHPQQAAAPPAPASAAASAAATAAAAAAST